MHSYKVELTPIAQKVYEEIYADAQACITAGDHTNAKLTTLRMVDDAIDNTIPHDPFSTTNALSGPLSNIFRVKKGRLRIYYAASSKEKKIVILYISPTLRKAGDVNDPYSIFTRMVMTGRFNEVFSRLGIRIPPKSTLQPMQISDLRWLPFIANRNLKLVLCHADSFPKTVVRRYACGNSNCTTTDIADSFSPLG